jgi:5-methylcytosine-specific restriction endonuclease McrBC regulatory subunit McrC
MMFPPFRTLILRENQRLPIAQPGELEGDFVTPEEAKQIVALVESLGTVDRRSAPKIDGEFMDFGLCVGGLSVPGCNIQLRPKPAFSTSGKPLTRGADGYVDLSRLVMSANQMYLPAAEYSSPGPFDEGLFVKYADSFTKDLLFIMHDGLRGGYVDVVEGVPSVRGRILFGDFSYLNRPHLIACSYQEFVYDTLLNRTLKRATKIIVSQALTDLDPDLLLMFNNVKSKGAQILDMMDEVADMPLCWDDVCDLNVERLDAKFARLLAFSKLLIKGNSPTVFADDSSLRSVSGGFSCLWDLSKLYELHVFNYLKKYVSECPDCIEKGVSVVGQDSSHKVFLDRKSNMVYADIVVYVKDSPVLIIDTKWKSLPTKSSEIDRNDAYQMLAYALTYSHGSSVRENAIPVCLLYPAIGKSRKPILETKFTGTHSPLIVAACPMDRGNLEFSPSVIFDSYWPVASNNSSPRSPDV